MNRQPTSTPLFQSAVRRTSSIEQGIAVLLILLCAAPSVALAGVILGQDKSAAAFIATP